jgi:hypothetical protein
VEELMSSFISIKVVDIIGTNLCISAEDGQKVFDKAFPLIKGGNPVIISFDHVAIVISLFLNVAIGQLYSEVSEKQIRALVKVEGLSGDDMELLKRVVDNAKKYYSNPDGYDRAWQHDEGDGNE